MTPAQYGHQAPATRPTSRQRAVDLPRLLPTSRGATSLADHLTRYGRPPSPGPDTKQRDALIEEVARAGLTGRGGAAFPTARKLAAVAAGRDPVVVANGTEGEPASFKDQVLLVRSPHLVLDGAVLAAELVGARRALVVVHHSARAAVDAAVTQRRRARAGPVQLTVVTAATGFVAGEASAVVHWAGRGVPTPLATPPRVSQRGLGGAPTLVCNVETLAHLALIARYGARWFRSIGTPAEPGSMLVTILGAVRDPCVAEVAIGTSVAEVLGLAGGPSAPLQAVLAGGYFGTWVSASKVLGRPLSAEGLADLGAAPGAGLVAALPVDSCGLRETARVVRYLGGESAGQCGPCLFGLAAVAGEMEHIAEGHTDGLSMLRRWLDQVGKRGACAHPDGAVQLVRSALEVFRAELAQHAHGWCCGTRTILPVPGRRRP
ncbi:MAG TPA: NADH-ubiquinone oxidoreductase-F iron-sulfur binding region domain-containing protein [Streptosporangiaceae bacterium]|nr:NADH-ubiquinone oxidoreductase-F iron-sulfur binding region domain-containing protein [Streptosporangiaceae bacterium]